MPKVIDESRVFEKAVALFVATGYEGTTTKEIAAAAGVNEATLFRRYGSKAKLIETAIDHQWRDVPLRAVNYSGNLENDLVAIVEAYVETSRLRGAIVPVLLVELARNQDLSGAFGLAMSNIRALAEIVARHQKGGRLRPEDPMTTVTTLLAPLMVDEMFRRTSVGPLPARIDAAEHVRAFLNGRSPDGVATAKQAGVGAD